MTETKEMMRSGSHVTRTNGRGRSVIEDDLINVVVGLSEVNSEAVLDEVLQVVVVLLILVRQDHRVHVRSFRLREMNMLSARNSECAYRDDFLLDTTDGQHSTGERDFARHCDVLLDGLVQSQRQERSDDRAASGWAVFRCGALRGIGNVLRRVQAPNGSTLTSGTWTWM